MTDPIDADTQAEEPIEGADDLPDEVRDGEIDDDVNEAEDSE